MALINKDFSKYPKFRHNLWTQYKNEPDIYYLMFSGGEYKVPKEDAEKFIQIRSFCTGHNTINQIANKSGLSNEKVQSIVSSLNDIEMLHLPITDVDQLNEARICNTLIDACRIWRAQLSETHLLNKILSGNSNLQITQGWLLETYHYIKNFPEAIHAAYTACDNQELKAILYKYYREEVGHEKFIEQTLLKTGLTSEEVKTSIPLVSTRLIDFLLKELFALCPPSVLLVASIIEAAEADIKSKGEVIKNLKNYYDISEDTMEPYFKHVQIDINLGHEKLLINNIEYIKLIKPEQLHIVVNMIHDIKHAIDLQQLEIEHYYNRRGNYFPRQFVDFYAI